MTLTAPATPRLPPPLRLLTRPPVIAGAAAWVTLNVVALALAGGVLPFDQPSMASLPFALRMAVPSVFLVEIFGMMLLVWALTRRRPAVDMAARAPATRTAAAETTGLLAYALLGEAGGWIVGPALGYRPFGFHLAGTLTGCSVPASPGEALTWSSYNVLVFAVAPYLWFRRRYSAGQLNLRSTNRTADLRVILTVGALESAIELAATYPGVFRMTPHAFLLAAPLTFAIYFVGTVLPTMVLIYAILLPRYARLTGSIPATVILGGLTYALMHLVEGWSNFGSPRYAALSLIFVFLNYVGPGMFKSWLTLGTGNAWVHALGYHAIAPHMLVDTPMIAEVFGIR
jgi:hypothetical protein